MTSVLSAMVPAGASRDAITALMTAAPRASAPVSPVESARAVRPVASATGAEIARNQTRRDKPVGPPPAFEINVLQDIRSRLVHPAPAEAAAAPPAAPARDGTPGAVDGAIEAETGKAPDAEPAADPTPRASLFATGAEVPHRLDMKV